MFVGNLSFQTSTEELRELFAQVGEVVSVAIPTDRNDGRPRGFAFVEMASPEHAAAAIEKLNGYALGGRNLRLDAASDQQGRPSSGGGAGFGAPRPGPRPARPKGSRRNVRARKRSIW